MLYREITAVCSEIHTKHINTLCGQNVELLNVKLVVHIVTTGLQNVNKHLCPYIRVCVYIYEVPFMLSAEPSKLQYSLFKLPPPPPTNNPTSTNQTSTDVTLH